MEDELIYMSIIIEKKIIAFIEENKIVKPIQIQEHFNLTQSTARRYLIKLEEKNLISRNFGEIIFNSNSVASDVDACTNINQNTILKKAIAKEAAKFSINHKMVFLDSGSLCYFMLEFLDKNIEIFTNSLLNARRASELGFTSINILGGKIKNKTLAIVDIDTSFLKNTHFPISFMGVNAICSEGNLWTPEISESKAKKSIINISKQIVVLAEESKFNKTSNFNFRPDDTNITIVTNLKSKLKIGNTKIIEVN